MTHECRFIKEGFTASFEAFSSDTFGYVRCRYCQQKESFDIALNTYFKALDDRLRPKGEITAKAGQVIYFDPELIGIERNPSGTMTVRIKELS